MPKFICKVRDNNTGKIEISEIEAASKDALINSLHEKNKLIISISEADLKPRAGAFKQRQVLKLPSPKRFFGISLNDKLTFCKQLATLLEGGVTLDNSLSILSQQVENEKFKISILRVREDVKKGLSLHKAFSKQPDKYSPLWIHLYKAGEASGQLPFVLNELGTYFELSANIRSKMFTALLYPIIVIIAAIAVSFVFFTFFVPVFSQLFESFNTPLPALTLMVINISKFLRSYLLYFLILFVILGFIFYRFIRTKKGRLAWDNFKLKFPFLGNFFLKVGMARFAMTLSILTRSGVPLLYALEIIKKIVGNVAISNVIGEIKESVRSGGEIIAPLVRSKLIPPMVAQMIHVGEESGELSGMLERLSQFYRKQIDTFIDRFSAIIEPTLILIVGAIVAVIVISMFLPILMRATFGGGPM